MSTSPIGSTSASVDLESIKLQVRSEIEPELRRDFERKKEVEIAQFKDELRKSNDETLREAIRNWEDEERKKRQPLDAEQLQTVLNKEYITFGVKIQYENKTIDFTLKELPQSIEREFYAITQKALSSISQELGGLNLKTFEGDILEKILGLMELFTPLQDILAKCCALCLDPPFGIDKKKRYDWLTETWISDNISNYRITAIVLAQVEVNKMRDFFSLLFQGFQSDATKMLASAQQ